MCDEELIRATKFNREKLSFPFKFLMNLFYDEVSSVHVRIMSEPGDIPDLWRIHKGRKMYLSTVVI